MIEQYTFIDLTPYTQAPSKKERVKIVAPLIKQEHQIEHVLGTIRELHQSLNAALYAAPASDRPQIISPAGAYNIMLPFLQPLEREEFWVMLLNVRARLINIARLYQGTQTQSTVHIGEIFRPAIIYDAVSILCFHNHPSGDPTPSPEDVSLTRSIHQAGKLLNIELCDHIVISSDGRYVSLKERGLGFGA